jgi:hypothetical protein
MADTNPPKNPRNEQNAFERLETLLAQLPAMQTEGERLGRAREARRLLELQRHLRVLEQEYQGYYAIHDTAKAAAQDALERDDATALARERGIMRGYAELIATRVAPLKRAQQTLEEAWQASPLTPDDSLEQLALDETTFAALEQNIADYQQDYEETYSRCQALMASLPPDPLPVDA